jgi:hypothetical protein
MAGGRVVSGERVGAVIAPLPVPETDETDEILAAPGSRLDEIDEILAAPGSRLDETDEILDALDALDATDDVAGIPTSPVRFPARF